MQTKSISQTGSRIVLLLGQFIVLMACVMLIDYVYRVDIFPDKVAAETFKQADCFLISKKLASRGHVVIQYRPDFLISYNVDGVQYNRWVSANGLDMSFGRNKRDQNRALNLYQIGKTYACWYSPANPELALLVPRHNWVTVFPLILPAAVLVVTVYYFLKNLMWFLALAPVKKRLFKRRASKDKPAKQKKH